MDEQLINKIKEVKVDWDKEALWEELEPQLPRPRKKFPWMIALLIVVLSTMIYGEKESWTAAPPTPAKGTEKNSVGLTAGIFNKATTKRTVKKITNHRHVATRQEANELFNKGTKSPRPVASSVHKPQLASNQQSRGEANSTGTSSIKEVAALPLSQEQNAIEQELEYLSLEKPISEPVSNISSQDHWQPADKINRLPALLLAEVVALENEPALPCQLKLLEEDWRIGRQAKGLFVELSAGIGSLNRSISAPAATAVERAVLLEKKNFEIPRFSLSGTLGIGYQLKGDFFLKSGLQRHEIHEQLRWQGISQIDTINFYNDRAFYSLSPTGDTTFYSGRSSRIETSKRDIRQWNRLVSYNIPLTFGYSKKYNRFSFQTSVGLVLNVSSQFKGQLLDGNNNTVENSEVFVSKKIGYTAGFGASYQLMDRHQVFINASYQRSPTFNVLNVEQVYKSANIQLGLRRFLQH